MLTVGIGLLLGGTALIASPESQPNQQNQQDHQNPDTSRKAPASKQKAKTPPKSARNGSRSGNAAKRPAARGPRRAAPAQQEARSSHAPAQRPEARRPALRLISRTDRRIPDRDYQANFGRQHGFRMGKPVLINGYSRFHYGGYSFGFMQPWPAQWLYSDDVYILFVDNGYYLYNPVHPGVRVAISVVF